MGYEQRSVYVADDRLTEGGVVYDRKTLKQLDKVYTDKFGNSYYKLRHAASMPHIRAIAAETSVRYAQMAVTRDVLETLIDEAIEAQNKQDLVRAGSKLMEIKTRLLFAAEERTLLTLATVYFYIEGEPIDSYDNYWQEKKMTLWEQDNTARDFFLELAWQSTLQYNSMSELNIIDYLQQVAHLVQTEFPESISPGRYKKRTNK